MKSMHMIRGAVALSMLLAVFFPVSRAESDFHQVEIDEIMAGANGNANIQYVEMKIFFDGQNNQGGNAKLVFFDATGAQTAEFSFPSNPSSNSTNPSFLVATQEFANVPNIPTPDFIMSPLVVPTSGKVCYRNIDNPKDPFTPNICLSYGDFTGSTEGFGSPAPGLPITGSLSLQRVNESSDSSTSFVLGAPAPCNSRGMCGTIPDTTDPVEIDPSDLIARGAEIFFNETFDGNGRTCGTCHPAENNFTLDPAFIAELPPNDPLFVAEFDPALAVLENPRLLREFGLILANVDGFDKPGVMRGIPHTLGLSTSVRSVAGHRTGWSGDGAPGDGSLRLFATGAVIQHFPKTLNRVPGVDFRLPTNAELDALEAFLLSLGRQADLILPLPLKGLGPRRGQQIFLDNTLGKCNLCHGNAGANTTLGPGNLGNLNFDTGVENLSNQRISLTGEAILPDGGFGTNPRPKGGFGDGSFNTPSLVEAADTGPFFHNNSVETIEEAVAFYNSSEFNNSPAVLDIGGGISLDETQVVAIAAFLRVINALENMRSAIHYQETALLTQDPIRIQSLLGLAGRDIQDGISVLQGGGLHPDAVALLEEANTLTGRHLIQEAIRKIEDARGLLVSSSPDKGDLDGSGRVDGFDLGVLGLAFGSRPGDGNWNPDADLNGDGIVDGSDLSILGMSFGKTM